MLAYRHQFHAGNFADVLKHALLAQLMLALHKKPKPFCYLDTHAGTGLFDFQHAWARKNAEFRDGIERLWRRDDIPEALAPYLQAVRAENAAGALRYYPGSPRIARRLLRAHDRMILSELNAKDCEALATLFGRDRQADVHLMDGYEALKAFLPPRERRGLVLIDSSFDRAQEFTRLARGFAAAHAKFATGIYALWYPLMDPASMQAFERRIAATGIRKILQVELSIAGAGWAGGMRGCGLLVVNPPFGFQEIARAIAEWLWPVLSREGGGGQRVRWLVPE
jgi:23S rRNA (adenine2030-N6)-methyltransferase